MGLILPRPLLGFVLVWALFAASEAAAKQPGPPPFANAQAVLKWINAYRARPEPDRLPDAVHTLAALAVFRDLETSGVYVGFMAGVLAENPAKAEKIVVRMFPIAPEDQVVIIRAIAYSGLPGWKDLLQAVAERMPARKVLIARHLDDKLPTLDKLALEGQPWALDAHWGFYFATGRVAAIGRVIDALAWVKDGNDLDRLTMGSMAKWTLANNALQDKALLDHLKAEALRRPKPVKTQIEETVEAAETYELAKIRKDAAASIEELKRKGPESTRKLTFWGQAGQTALALGCVVAGALGQPQVAVPCVIGGAASSAALRLMTPQ